MGSMHAEVPQFRKLMESTPKGQEALRTKNPDFAKKVEMFKQVFAGDVTSAEANVKTLEIMGGEPFEVQLVVVASLKGKKKEAALERLDNTLKAACVGLLESGNIEAQNAFKTGLQSEAVLALPKIAAGMEMYMMPYLFNDSGLMFVQQKYNEKAVTTGGRLGRDDFLAYTEEIKKISNPDKGVQKEEMVGALETIIAAREKNLPKLSPFDVLNKLHEKYGVKLIESVVETPKAAAGGGAENGGGKPPKPPEKPKGSDKDPKDDKYEKMFEKVKNEELKKALIELEKAAEEMQKRKDKLNVDDVKKLAELQEKLEKVQPKLDPKNRDDLRFLNNSLVEVDAALEHAEKTGAKKRPAPGTEAAKTDEEKGIVFDKMLGKIDETIKTINDPNLKTEFEALSEKVNGWNEMEKRGLIVVKESKPEVYLKFGEILKESMGKKNVSSKDKDTAAEWIKAIENKVLATSTVDTAETPKIDFRKDLATLKNESLKDSILDLREMMEKWHVDPTSISNTEKIKYLQEKIKELNIIGEPINKLMSEIQAKTEVLHKKYVDSLQPNEKNFFAQEYARNLQKFNEDLIPEAYLSHSLRECRSRMDVLQKAIKPSDGSREATGRLALDKDGNEISIKIVNENLKKIVNEYYNDLDMTKEVDQESGKTKNKISMRDWSEKLEEWRKKIYDAAFNLRGSDRNNAVDIIREIDSELAVLNNEYRSDYWIKSMNSFRLAEAEYNMYTQGCLDGTITPDFMNKIPPIRAYEGVTLDEWKIMCEVRNRWLNAASNKIKDGAGNRVVDVLSIATFSLSHSEWALFRRKMPRFAEIYDGIVQHFFMKSYYEPDAAKGAYFLQYTKEGYQDFMNKSPQEIKRDLWNDFKIKKDKNGKPWISEDLPEEYLKDAFNAAWNLIWDSFMFCNADVGWYDNGKGKMVRRKAFPGGKIKSWFEYATAAAADPNQRAVNKWVEKLDRIGFGGSIGAWLIGLYRRGGSSKKVYDNIIRRMQKGEAVIFPKRMLVDFASFVSVIRTDIEEFEHENPKDLKSKVILDQNGMPKPGSLKFFNRDTPEGDAAFKARMKYVNISLAQATIDGGGIPYSYKYPYKSVVENEETHKIDEVTIYADLNTNWGMKYFADMMKNMVNAYKLITTGVIKEGKKPTRDDVNEALQDMKVLRVGGEFADNRPFEVNEYNTKFYAVVLANWKGISDEYDHWQFNFMATDGPQVVNLLMRDSWYKFIPKGVDRNELLDIFHARQGLFQQISRNLNEMKIGVRNISYGFDLFRRNPRKKHLQEREYPEDIFDYERQTQNEELVSQSMKEEE